MEEKWSAARKAIDAERAALTEETLGKMGHLAGEASALETVLDYFVRMSKPDQRDAIARQIRRVLMDEPSGSPSTFDDGFASTVTKVLARLDGLGSATPEPPTASVPD